MKRFCLTLALVFATLPAHAAITIDALTQLCSYDANGNETAPGAHASCQSYIAGIIDYHDLYKSIGQTGVKVDYCLPPALTYADLQRIILEKLQKNSAFPDSPASSAVVLGLRDEFPCDASALMGSEDQALSIDAPSTPAPDVTTGDVLNTPAQ